MTRVGGCRSPEHAAKIAESVRKHCQSRTEEQREAFRLMNTEIKVGGFWYGSVINDRGSNQYCSKWNRYLKERIRAYWGYVSALSGLPERTISRKTGLPQSISCHHVYYQKSACCFWDEDEKGYYVNLNTVSSKKNPQYERYYIEDGNPNKFVTLTKHEHRQTETDKIKWIKVFEQIILDTGGKSYLTDKDIEEMEMCDNYSL